MKKILFFLAVSFAANSQIPKLSIPHERYSLKNGLTVILAPDKATPLVAISLWYNVGARNEKPKKTGLAHLFEHLMFEGSTFANNDAHFRLLEKNGASKINASTSLDRTNYYETVPKDKLELALALESSRMSFLQVTKEKLDEQRKVVLNEKKQRYDNSPYGLAFFKLWNKLFPKGHPFHNNVIGSDKDLNNASLADVIGFYEEFYGPNATLTLVGDFEIDQVKKLIDTYFSTLKAKPKIYAPKVPVPKVTKEEVIRFDEKLGKLPFIRMHYITPPLFKEGDAELDILSHILTANESSRLTKELMRTNSLAASVNTFQQSMGSLSIFTIDVQVKEHIKADDVIEKIDEVLQKISKDGVLPIEIERARNHILTENVFRLQELGGQNGRAEILQGYNFYADDSDYIDKDIERYYKIHNQNIVKTVNNFLQKNQRIVLIAKPTVSPLAERK